MICALVVLATVFGPTASKVDAALTWSTDAITLEINELEVVQIYSDIPEYHEYGVLMGNDASIVAEIIAVTPLFIAGPLATATEDYMGNIGWWYLENGWDITKPIPISHWGDHWDVSIKGLAMGDYSLHIDYDEYYYEGSDDVLLITVVPEPATLLLLGLGGLMLRRKRRA